MDEDAKYKIKRVYADPSKKATTIKRGLTLSQARAHCSDPNTSYTCKKDPNKSWMDVFYKE